MIKRIAAVTAIVMGVGVGVEAQTHQHAQEQDSASMQMAHGMMMGGMMGQGMMGEGMMEMMGQGMAMMATGGPGPRMVLRLRDELELTPEQVRSLEALQEEAGSHMEGGMMQSMMAAHRNAAETLKEDDPDLDAYRRGLEDLAEMMVEAHVSMARAALEVRTVLTPEQRQKLEEQRMKMMEGGMDGMMQHRPGGDAPGHRR